ncbi:hypothetical protein DMX05_00700 [Pseudomonas soli]|nr:hypothetical protein DMX05_00700 [Pseudomonas soli]
MPWVTERVLKKIIGLTLVAAGLHGCSFYEKTNIRNEAETAKYDPATTARIRAFTSPEITGSYQANATCEQYRPLQTKEGTPLTVTFKDRTSTKQYMLWRRVDLLGMVEEDYINRTIGVPASTTTEELKNDRVGYNEHVIPAGKPIVLSLGFHAVSDQGKAWCYPKPVYLVPQAGKDYEVRYITVKESFMSSSCKVAVSELTGNGPVKTPQPVKTGVCVPDKGYLYRTVGP